MKPRRLGFLDPTLMKRPNAARFRAVVLALFLLGALLLFSIAPDVSAASRSTGNVPFQGTFRVTQKTGQQPEVPGEVIVEYARGATPQTNHVASIGGAILKRSHEADSSKSISYAVYDSSTLSTSQLVDSFKNVPGVLRVSPNNISSCTGGSTVVPNDPYFGQQWGLSQIGAQEAWAITTGGKEPVVAVIDSGVDYTHPDLQANIWSDPASGVHGLNAYSGNYDPKDANGHGTHVAGIIAGVGNNGTGIAGVSWAATIMPLRFTDASGSGTDSAAIQCIDYAIDEKLNHGVDVVAINASWGGYGGYDGVLADAIQAAGNAGIIFVAAAGNGDDSGGNPVDDDLQPFYPASYPCSNIISVGASDSSDAPASFSNYGPTGVDLFAPGVNILSTYPNNSYESLSGTSMATPFVSGTIALLATASPSDSVATRIDRVLQTVDPEASMTGKCVTGGRLDLAKALESCASVAGVEPSSGPVAGGTSVVIFGRNLSNVSQVTFGGVAASYTVDSSTQITAAAPPHAPGKVAVTVTADGVASADLGSATEFTYVTRPPTVTAVSPSAALVTGATTVTISGTNLAGTTAVKFGGVLATSFTVNSSTKITAVAPPHAAGKVDVTITTPGGTTTTAGTANDFYYLARIEQSDSRMLFGGTWHTWASSALSGGSYKYSSAPGAYVVVPFSGTRLDLIGSKGPNMGIASISLDGKTAVTCDLYKTTGANRQVIYTTGALSGGQHWVKISHTETKNMSSTGTYIDLDAVDVAGTLSSPTGIEQTDSHIVYSSGWASLSTTSASGGSYKCTNTAGASATITFTGTSISVIATKASSYGKVKITLDGGTPKYLDLYSATALFKQTVYSSGFLTPGTHTLKIERSSQKNAASTGYTVSLDAVDVRGVLN